MMDKVRDFWMLFYLLATVNGELGTSPRITEHPVDLTVPRNDPATLQCSADGIPAPEIQWFRDGEPVAVAPTDAKSHRVLLPGGALFFLRVSAGRRDSDAGVYWCVAKNSYGVARSKNATLTVAYIQSEFRAVPQVIRAIQGESIIMECEPPKGQPEPQVRWRKDGQILDLVNLAPRVRLEPGGSLLITAVSSADTGRYQCVASNVAGTRESPAALLSVHVKPEIVRSPQNHAVLSGEDAYFECIASGDPLPLIVWKKGNTQVAEGRSLRLESVTPAEQGNYICQVENIVGSAVANATLTVYVPPTVTSIERFTRVDTGSTASLPCTAEGLPTPDLLWTKEGLSEWGALHAGSSRDNDKISVTVDGTLTIKDVGPDDAGTYTCIAVNPGGADISRTRLLLISKRPAKLPPVISIGPANQTLPIRSLGILQCEAEAASTTWIKDGKAVIPEGRISITENGALRIEDLRSTDAGTYLCIARNSGGDTAWSSSLAIESPTNPNVAFFRSTNDPLALPGSPSQPRLLSRGVASLTITWRSGGRMGASPLLGYMVEVLSTDGPAEFKGRWRTVARRLQTDMFTLTDLRPGSSHIVIVRAENSHGLSLPSPPSDWLEISDSSEREDEGEVEQVREALSPRVLKLEKVVPVNSTAVRITWEILDSESYMDTLDLNFLMERPGTKSKVQNIGEPGALSMVITDLEPNSKYTFFLVPRGKGIIGRPSNSKDVTTLEDAPSAPPASVDARVLNSTSVLIRWDAPSQTNGQVIGYQIFIQDSDKNQAFNMTVLSHVTTAVVNSLLPGRAYAVRLLALSKAGAGPLSNPVEFVLDRDKDVVGRRYPNEGITADLSEVVRETWFAVLIGGLLVAAILVLVAAILARKRIAQKKAMGHLYPTLQKSSEIGQLDNRDSYWSRGWQAKDCDSSLSASKLLPHDAHGPDPLYAELSTGPVLTSFHQRQNYSTPAAYATTTLIGACYKSGHAPRIVNEQPPPDVLADSRGYIHSNPLHGLEMDMLSPSSDSSSCMTDTERPRTQKSKGVPNWSDLLPPPPSYPPYQENFSKTFGGNQSIVGIVSKPPGGSVQSTPAVTKRNGIIFTSSDGLNPMTPAPRRQFLASQRCDSRSSSSSRSSNRRKEEQKNPEMEKMLNHSTERGVQSSLPSLAGESVKGQPNLNDESPQGEGDQYEFESPLYAETDLMNKFWSSTSPVYR